VLAVRFNKGKIKLRDPKKEEVHVGNGEPSV
jgi:hypothetical protein